MKRNYILVILVLVLIGLIIFRLAANKKTIDKKREVSTDSIVRIPVKAVAVTQERIKTNLVKTGSVAAFKEAKAFATVPGIIQRLTFDLGDHVSLGHVMAVMDTRALQLDLQKAKTSAEKLGRDLETYTDLLHGGAATQEKVNEIRQNFLDAENQVSQAKKKLADATVKAPTSGMIAEKKVEQGIYVAAGAELATIVNLSEAKVQLNVTEKEVYQIKKGQQVKITTDVYRDQEFKGRISYISPKADQIHNYSVEIMVENKESALLRSGTFVYADFSRQSEENSMFIPRESLNGSIKDASVYVVQNGVVHMKTIKTGIEMAGKIQVTSGLQPAEMVVTSGQINLKEGSKVSISKQ